MSCLSRQVYQKMARELAMPSSVSLSHSIRRLILGTAVSRCDVTIENFDFFLLCYIISYSKEEKIEVSKLKEEALGCSTDSRVTI